MAKKEYILIVDSETANNAQIADFGAVVIDRKGNIQTQCAVLVNEVFGVHPLFVDSTADPESIWSQAGQKRRLNTYAAMLNGGTRMIASISAVNRWLDKVKSTFDPYLTAYNLPFDLDKANKTGIDLAQFEKRFCMWAAAADRWAFTKKYRQFALMCHAFNIPTKLGNMTYKANAEIMARFVLNNPNLEDEPHTALEDILFYELPIMVELAKKRKLKDFIGLTSPDWRKMQVKDWFSAK